MKFYKEGQNQNLILFHLFFFKSYFGIYLQVSFDKFQNQPPGEPREHHLGEVLQGRSKSKFYITLSYLIVLFVFWVQGHIPNYLEMKKILFQRTCSKGASLLKLILPLEKPQLDFLDLGRNPIL